MSVPLVLVVEDSQSNRAILREFLEDGGARVIEADTGESATALALEHRPDVIVLDVVLPDADGIRLCRRWRKEPRLETLPVLLISGERLEDEDRASGLDSGAYGYLAKPFSDVELMAQVNLLHRLGGTHRQLTEQNRQLESSFRELDQFARVVSHDLKEPLRTITNHCRLLQERTAGQLDDESARLVEQAVSGSERMQHLIDDLLCYCRAAQEDPPSEAVDLNGVLDEVVEHLDAAIRESGARVEVEPLPQVRGCRRMMVQLFQNLVGNAVKFHGPAAPTVRVAARKGSKKCCQIVVRDNGIGILPRDHERIFGVFERLRTEVPRPGTGIGLAICKKIVHRHGGRMWVESEPGRGAAFHVELTSAATLQPATR